MSKRSLTSLIVLSTALAACSDGDASRTVTAPDAGPAFSEAAADLDFALTPDGPTDFTLASEDAIAQMAGAQVLGAQMAASAQAATGSRSSGHVGFPTGWPGTPISFQKYSYTALGTTSATPFSAKGRFEGTVVNAGVEQKVHGEVLCMNVFGNTARVGGRITKYWVDGVPTPINPLRTNVIWVVVDNGEGASNPDAVSLQRFGNAAGMQLYCATGFLSFVAPNQEGNVQVQP